MERPPKNPLAEEQPGTHQEVQLEPLPRATSTEKGGGPILISIICQLLTTNEKEEKEWWRTSIFWTRVRCKGKLSNLIIDGGSTMNIVE